MNKKRIGIFIALLAMVCMGLRAQSATSLRINEVLVVNDQNYQDDYGLHKALGSGVDGGRSLVEYQHGRVCDCRSRYRKKLALTLREVRAVAGQHGAVAVRKALNEAVSIRELCGRDALLVGGVKTSVADIVHYRAGEQVCILENQSQ